MFVALQYEYKVNWESNHGLMNKPYLFATNYAEAYVRHHPAGSELRVRVHPTNPERSFPILD
jgi:hypothetical protein